jgi:hypothetical protein
MTFAMWITLTSSQIESAIPATAIGLAKYVWLQKNLRITDVRADRNFRRRFNGFYRIRRGEDWQRSFFELLEEMKSNPLPFSEILASLFRSTGRYEASFASKLLATIDPKNPVIDRFVLTNLRLRLPLNGCKDRQRRICDIYAAISSILGNFLETASGRYIVQRFRAVHPEADITEMKMLDLILWQTRT